MDRDRGKWNETVAWIWSRPAPSANIGCGKEVHAWMCHGERCDYGPVEQCVGPVVGGAGVCRRGGEAKKASEETYGSRMAMKAIS